MEQTVNLTDLGAIREVRFERRKSAKTGNDYGVIIIRFTNDYELENFTTSEQTTILGYIEREKSAVDGGSILDDEPEEKSKPTGFPKR